jgi:hypothetical protein
MLRYILSILTKIEGKQRRQTNLGCNTYIHGKEAPCIILNKQKCQNRRAEQVFSGEFVPVGGERYGERV